MPIKIGLLGFGRTGSVVAKELAIDKNLSLEWVCKRSLPTDLKFASRPLGFSRDFAPFYSSEQLEKSFHHLPKVDIIVDFSSGLGSKMYHHFADAGIKIVSAISNYTLEELSLVKMASQKTAVLYSPNITLGINWLMLASKMLKKVIPYADIEVIEEHFRDKRDISGTALKLAHELNLDPDQRVNSIRIGGVVGKHEVVFGLPHQTIRLTHESISRSAFGTGAIFAAKWLQRKGGGLYTMEEALQDIFLPDNKILA